jgi:hypothetical protein
MSPLFWYLPLMIISGVYDAFLPSDALQSDAPKATVRSEASKRRDMRR